MIRTHIFEIRRTLRVVRWALRSATALGPRFVKASVAARRYLGHRNAIGKDMKKWPVPFGPPSFRAALVLVQLWKRRGTTLGKGRRISIGMKPEAVQLNTIKSIVRTPCFCGKAHRPNYGGEALPCSDALMRSSEHPENHP